MPWIGRMHMVVAMDSQVPSWVNRDTVDVVLHEQIIPQYQLPTFNTMTIVKFMSFAPGLSQKYVMSCDDFYAVNPISRDILFDKDGVGLNSSDSSACIEFNDLWQYGRISRNTYAKFRDYCNRNGLSSKLDEVFGASGNKHPVFLHNFVPCDRNEATKVLKDTGILDEEYEKTRSPGDSCTIEMLCWLNMLRTSPGCGPRTTTVYNEPEKDEVWNSIEHFKTYMDRVTKGVHCLCVNSHTEWTRAATAEWFESKFPEKCKYEI